MPDTPLPSYAELLAMDPATVAPRAALAFLGRLTATATTLEDAEGLRHAIAIAPTIATRLTTPVEHATLQYYLGNSWSELQRCQPAALERIWEWDQPECEQAILAYRTAIQSDGFKSLRAHEQSSVLTNLGNLFDHLGRTIEAIHAWELALRTTPGFGMARGNRALGLSTYAHHLHDPGHKRVFLKTAHAELTTALTEDLEPHARQGFTKTRDVLTQTLTHEYLARPLDLDGFSLGTTDEEVAYRKRLLRARLFLNPLNDLGPYPIGARDSLSTPPMVVKIHAAGPIAQGALNQLKQEYVAARFLYDQGTQHSTPPHYADNEVRLTDTMDYPAYGLRREFLRAAFRIAYSLLDKTASFLNVYLALGIPEHRVAFRTLWYDKLEQRRGLRPAFKVRENLPLRALYWLAKDLAPDETVVGTLDPDAQNLAQIRNHLEHKFLKLHTQGFPGPTPHEATGDLADTLPLHLNEHAFARKALHLLRLSRAAIIYLTLAIHCEERDRAAKLSPDEMIGHIRLDSLSD
ncbi:MAG: LA2681 family HEPN domain-containing protein [Thermoanaerobaculia bacterium]